MKIQMEIEETADNYKNILNDNLEVPQEQIEMVNIEILLLDIKNFKSIKLSLEEFKIAFNSTSTSKACGNDNTSLFMIHNLESSFINKIIFPFFSNIFKYGLIPSNLNVTYILPIIKDIKKPTNTINNIRPISISNPFAQIFERILLNKIPNILNTHQNQFGYKNKTSCSHALFAFKETIIHHL
jgi:hypothetical protein